MNKNNEIIIQDEVPSLEEESKTTVKPVHQQNNVGASSQMQLLDTAKAFLLDGGLVAPEKQAPIVERSEQRERLNASRKQINLESIIKKSLSYCSNEDATSKMDPDWFFTFSQLAEDISNKTMQGLWAKILASEVSKPGSFSIKTIKAFREMTITDAKLFAKACSLAISDHGKKNIRIISGGYQVPGILNFFNKNREQTIHLNHFSLNYGELLALADNHLIFIQETELSVFHQAVPLPFIYNGLPITIKAKKDQCLLKFFKFTQIGTELAHLITDNVDDIYFQTLKSNLSENFSIEESK
jgi:uncharacterized repeat protein (TIGR03899 family)